MTTPPNPALEAAQRILDYWDIPSGRMPRAPHSQDEVMVARALIAYWETPATTQMNVKMKEDGHTPGPWIAAAGPSSIVGWPVVSRTGRSICRLTWFERASPAGEAEETKEETRANARLIAAAPIMFDYIKLMAANGDPDAIEIMESINREAREP